MVGHNAHLIRACDAAETRRDARGAIETLFETRMGRDRQSYRGRQTVGNHLVPMSNVVHIQGSFARGDIAGHRVPSSSDALEFF